MKLAKFQGVTTPVQDLAVAIQNQGWSLGQVVFDNKLNAYTAVAISPHGEQLQKTGPDENTAVANALLAVTRRNHMRTTAQFKVGMWRTNWHERLPEIAEAYRDAPIYDPKAVAAWKALGDDSAHRLHVLSGQLHIEPTNNPQPYATADDMRKDVHEKRHYYLSQAGTAHPVWTSDQVSAFRAVHDILGHGVAGGHYDWPGRNLAAAAHMPLLEPLAQQALFAETVARQAALQTYGHMPHKIALFPEFVEHHQAINQGGAHRGIHPSQTTAPVAVPKPFAFESAFVLPGKTAQEANAVDVNKGWTSGVEPLPQNAYIHHGDPLQMKASMDNARLIDTGWSNFQKGDGSDDRERMKLAIVNAFRVVLLSPRKDLRWNAIHYQDISNIPGSVDDPKVYWDTLENARRTWNSKQGIDPNAHMIYFKFLKPFEARIAAQHPEKGWEWAQKEAKQTLFNWWTEEQERIQQGDADKPAEKQRGADEIERRANEALAKRMQLFLKPKDEKTDVEDTQMSMFGSDEMKRRYADLFSESPTMEPNNKASNNGWVYYHVAPASARHSILQHGIDYTKGRSGTDYDLIGSQPANYLWPDIERAQRSKAEHEADHPFEHEWDIWQVNPDGLQLESDPYGGIYEGAKRSLTPIPPHALTHMSKIAAGQYNLLTGEEGLKYGAFMGTHLKSISQVSQHADEILDAALEDVRNHDAEGHHFRQRVLSLNVPGVGPKVCSFAWLLLQPMTSQLATMDVHMMDVLGRNYEKEMNNRDYFKFEREFRAGLDAAGYGHMPLGVGQWAMWDYKRTGPGTHQDHSSMRVLDPKPHQEVAWAAKAPTTTEFKKNWADSVDWWAATKPAREAVGQEWDQTYGTNFKRGVVPYQDLGSHVISATTKSDEFHVAWKVPDSVLDTLHQWATEQDFGKIEDRGDLHMTAFYLPEGYKDKSLHKWIEESDALGHFADPTLEFFPSQEGKGVAVVVRFNSDMGKKVGERLIDEAEEKGLEPKRFPGGYKPHITIAHADSEPEKVKPPPVSFDSSELSVSPPRKTAKIAYGEHFDHYWDKLTPIGSDLDGKARSLAEYAKADHMEPDEVEEWLADPENKRDTRLSDSDYKRFKKKLMNKFDRISKVATVLPTPVFKHPETGEFAEGMPGQSMMEHARLHTGLSTQDVWRLLADEHVQKV